VLAWQPVFKNSLSLCPSPSINRSSFRYPNSFQSTIVTMSGLSVKLKTPQTGEYDQPTGL
jgi:hypothetical protein